MAPPDRGSDRAPQRLLVTGAGGFVGPWALQALCAHAPDAVLHAVDRRGTGAASRTTPADPAGGASGDVRWAALDVADRAAVDDLVRTVRPTGVLHLAAVSDIAAARADPALAWRVNLDGALALAHATLRHATEARFVFASTSEVYGLSFRTAAGPLAEDAALAPANPYAATKAAAEIALRQLALDGLRATIFRPFNHTGPGQDERFVCAAFAAQIARIEAGLAAPTIRVGNLDAERDFLDVRDVARAYALALTTEAAPAAGTTLNLASGRGRRIGAVLDALCARARVAVRVEVDPERLRPLDTPRAVGDAGAARRALGWAPGVAWETTLDDLLADWRARV